MANSGLAPKTILMAATGGAAKALKFAGIGTLEKGKWADLVIYDKNPLEDIANTKTISAVYVAGNKIDR